MDINLSLSFNEQGNTSLASEVKHIRDLIEQILFTSPGERVNRPTFGCGLSQMVFEPNSTELAATTQYLIQGALNQWLGELIEVRQAEVRAEENSLVVNIVYKHIRSQQIQQIQISR